VPGDRTIVIGLLLKKMQKTSIAKPLRENSMDAITTHRAIENLDGLIEKVIADMEPTILCNDQGNRAVLMSLDEFNSWQETLYLLSNPANADHLIRSIQESAAGNRSERSLIES
jgi:antitoxin YefM